MDIRAKLIPRLQQDYAGAAPRPADVSLDIQKACA